jgi:hypothetical protein
MLYLNKEYVESVNVDHNIGNNYFVKMLKIMEVDKNYFYNHYFVYNDAFECYDQIRKKRKMSDFVFNYGEGCRIFSLNEKCSINKQSHTCHASRALFFSIVFFNRCMCVIEGLLPFRIENEVMRGNTILMAMYKYNTILTKLEKSNINSPFKLFNLTLMHEFTTKRKDIFPPLCDIRAYLFILK